VPADVEPVAIEQIGADGLADLEHPQHEVRYVEAALWNQLDRPRLQRVDAHADDVGQLRLLVIARHHVRLAGGPRHAEHAVVDVHDTPVCGDRHGVAGAPVKIEELAVVQVCEQVPVHDQEGAVDITELPQRAGRAERLGLVQVLDRHSMVRAVAEHGFDQVAQVADRERQVREPVGRELPDDNVEDRPIADRHERLR